MAQDVETCSASKLLIVSNRLPVTIRQDDDGEIAIARSAGGLATALARAHTQGDSVWIGWPGDYFDDTGWNLDKWLQRGIEMDNAVIGEIRSVTFGLHL